MIFLIKTAFSVVEFKWEARTDLTVLGRCYVAVVLVVTVVKFIWKIQGGLRHHHTLELLALLSLLLSIFQGVVCSPKISRFKR